MSILLFLMSIPLILWVLKVFKGKAENTDIIYDTSEEIPSESEETEQTVIVKSPSFDVSKIKEYLGKEIKTFKFNPSNWNEYIGQKNAKIKIQSFIKGTTENNTVFPHTIIDGQAGFGKTTLVYLLKKYLNAEIIEHIGTEITAPEQIIDILNKINASTNQQVILFIDEVHNIPSNIIEIFYPIMQEGKISNKVIKPFTFVGATTEKGKLLSKFKPFIDRFELHITLEDYTLEETKIIMEQFKDKVFPEKKITEEIYYTLAKCCRLTPRKAKRLIKNYIYINDLDRTLEVNNIIDREIGLTKTDLKILNYLARNDKVGLQGLCSYLDTSQENYLYQFEPYLIKKELITRTPRGRSIGDKGKGFLRNFKNEK